MKLKWVDENRQQEISEQSAGQVLKTLAFIMYQYHVNVLALPARTLRVKRNVVKLAIP